MYFSVFLFLFFVLNGSMSKKTLSIFSFAKLQRKNEFILFFILFFSSFFFLGVEYKFAEITGFCIL